VSRDEWLAARAEHLRRTLADLFDAFTMARVRHHDRYATAPATA
jgi:hypothetical protein